MYLSFKRFLHFLTTVFQRAVSSKRPSTNANAKETACSGQEVHWKEQMSDFRKRLNTKDNGKISRHPRFIFKNAEMPVFLLFFRF